MIEERKRARVVGRERERESVWEVSGREERKKEKKTEERGGVRWGRERERGAR